MRVVRPSVQSPLLLDDEIVRVDGIYLRFTDLLHIACVEDPLAETLHRPKLPELLSESIAARIVESTGATVTRGGREADLLSTCAHAETRRAEIKGTGTGVGWTMLTRKDNGADDLIWVSYATRLENHDAPVDVTVVDLRRVPRPKAGRVLLGNLIARFPSGALTRYRCSFPGLEISHHPTEKS